MNLLIVVYDSVSIIVMQSRAAQPGRCAPTEKEGLESKMNTRRPIPPTPSIRDALAEFTAISPPRPLWVRLAQFAARPAAHYAADWDTNRAANLRFAALAARLFRLPLGRLEDNLVAADPVGSAAFIGHQIRCQAARRNARRLADSEGIACWPLLLDAQQRHGWDWRKAIPAAEAALAPRHGRYAGKDCRGGFDSCGFHGWNADQLRAAWRVAGCRDTGKFRLLVRNHADWHIVRKGDTLPGRI